MATMRTLIGTDDVNYITPYFNTWKAANGLSYTLSTIADTTLIPTTVSSLKTGKGNDAIYRTKLTGTINIDTDGGNDIIVMNANNSSAQGQSGKDFVMGIGNKNFLHGGNDSDLVVAFGTSNFVHGGSGNDYLIAMAPNNIQGNNTLSGDSGNDIMDVLQDFYATLQFNGLRSSYTITRSSILDGTYTITGPDGTDTIIGHRSTTLKFDNMSIQLKGLFADRAPIAVLDTNTINEDAVAPVTGNVLTNDKDPDLDPIRVKTVDGTPVTLAGITINTSPWGSLFIQQNGSYSFAVNHPYVDQLGAGQTQAVVFSYVIESQYFGPGSSPALFSSPTTLTITILGVNDPATITGTATGAVQEDGTLFASGLLSVSDLDAGEAHFQNPGSLIKTYGTFTFADGAWGYTLNNGAVNVQALAQGQQVHDMLTVTSIDGTASQVIDVTITGTNDDPVAVNDGQVATTDQNTGTTLSESVFLANDTDKDNGHVLSIASVSGDSHISLVSGNVVFTPGTDFAHLAEGETATVNFSYIAKDEFGALSGPATASIQVTGLNDAPVANDDTVSPDIPDNEPTIILASSLLSNDTDVDNGDAALLYINSVGNAVNGTVALLLDGNVEFTPTSGYSGPASFTYTVSDTHPGGISVLPATVSFTVFIANQPPTAVDDTFPADDIVNASSIALGNVLTNDTDPDVGDTREVVSASYVEFNLSSPVNLAGLGATGSLSVAPAALVGVEKAHFLITPTGVLANEGGAEIPAELIIMEDGSVHVIKNNAFDFLPDGDTLTLKFSYTMEDSVGLQSTADLDITIMGTDNKDVYIGAGTNNTLNGGSENDLLNGGLGTDTLLGGMGNDTLIFSVDGVWPSGQNFLNTFTGQLILVAGMNRSFDTYSGGSEYDILIGSSGNDGILRNSFTSILIPDIEEIHAGAGNDIVDMSSYTHITTPFILYGEAGNDVLWGEAGDDTLIGGSDNDSLDGGTGNDTFVFDVGGFGVDEITTYEIANDILNFINVPDVNSNMEDLDDLNDLVLSVTDSGLGGDVVITFNNGSSVTLTGIGTGSLNTLIALNNTINIQVNGVDIPDVNEAPTAVVLSNPVTSTPENGATLKVADIAITDDALGTNVLSLSGADAGSFYLVGTELWFDGNADFETKAAYDVIVNVDDASVGGSPDAFTAFHLDITDVNEAPTAVVLSNQVTSTPENGAAIKIADIAITDDALGTNVITLSGADAGFFYLVGNELWFNGSANYEAKASYDVTVNVDDVDVGGSPDSFASVHLDITDVNEAPTALNDVVLVNDSVDNSLIPLGNVLGNDTDPDAGDTKTVVSADFVQLLLSSPTNLAGLGTTVIGGFNISLGALAPGEVAHILLTPTGALANDTILGGTEIPAEFIIMEDGSAYLIKNNAFDFVPQGDTLIAKFSYVMEDSGGLQSAAFFDIFISGQDNKDVFALSSTASIAISGGVNADILTAGSGDYQELYGDALEMSGTTQGGDDILKAGSGLSQIIYGDTYFMFNDAMGGNDILTAGSGSGQFLYGDALIMFDNTQGGNDTLTLGSGDGQELFGEAYYMYNNAVGGNDILTAGSVNGQKIKGDAVYMIDNSVGGDDTITGGSGSNQELNGDAYQMYGTTQGGDDILTSGSGSGQFLFGDAIDMFDNTVGGDDTLTLGSVGSQELFGEAYYMYHNAVGGNDILTAGSGNGQKFTGDAVVMYDNTVGGNDIMMAGSGSNQELRGDAYVMFGYTKGGNDTITNGIGADQVIIGDGVFMYDTSLGGDDILTGGAGTYQKIRGDAYEMYGNSVGGDDTITAGSGSDQYLEGDASSMYDDARGGNDTLILGSISGQGLSGDAFIMNNNAVGGDDTITGGSGDSQVMGGDGYYMYDNAVGGDDTITGGAGAYQKIRGDAYQMYENSVGGDDTITAGSGTDQYLEGDASSMYNNARGGNDTLILGSISGQGLSGDAFVMNNNAVGGDDTITGGSGDNQAMTGDGYYMYDSTVGGDDILAAGSGLGQTLYGDAVVMLGTSGGGNDTLISGINNDQMWGDAAFKDITVTTGADTFIFDVSGFGDDTVGDFEASKDILNFTNVADVDFDGSDFDDLAALVSGVTDGGGNIVVDFISGNSVTLAGIGGTLGDGNMGSLSELNDAIFIQVNGALI